MKSTLRKKWEWLNHVVQLPMFLFQGLDNYDRGHQKVMFLPLHFVQYLRPYPKGPYPPYYLSKHLGCGFGTVTRNNTS